MKISLAANEVIRGLLTTRGSGPKAGLLITSRPGGCQGMSYAMDILADVPRGCEIMRLPGGLRIFLEPGTAAWVRELSVDYVDDGLNLGFTFENPQAASTCGCGSSFRSRQGGNDA